MEIRGLLVDVDGVLIQGGAALPGAPEALRVLAARDVPYRLVTNTTQRGRATLPGRPQPLTDRRFGDTQRGSNGALFPARV